MVLVSNPIQLVRQFMQKFKQPTPRHPIAPNKELLLLRATLIVEEMLETLDGMGISIYVGDTKICNDAKCRLEWTGLYDPVATADGLIDLDYVVLGAFHAFGLPYNSLFQEVHRSNMSKLWTNEEITAVQLHEFNVSMILNEPWDGERMYLVTNSDGKVVKSPSYSPANLAPIIERHSLNAIPQKY